MKKYCEMTIRICIEAESEKDARAAMDELRRDPPVIARSSVGVHTSYRIGSELLSVEHVPAPVKEMARRRDRAARQKGKGEDNE